MIKKNFTKMVAVLAFTALVSCSKKDDTKTLTCNLATPEATALASGTVVYTVNTTGSASVTKITYKNNDGDVTVNSPAIPYTVTVNVNKDTPIGISGTGTAKVGSINVAYAFSSNSGGTTITTDGSDSCENR